MRLTGALGAIVAGVMAGCVTTPVPNPGGPTPIATGSVDAFEALVPEPTGDARCVEPRGAPVSQGDRAIALLYPERPQRQVTLTLDAEGTPTRYLDVRGDLSDASDGGDRTTIGLFLVQGYAVLSNRRGADQPTMLEVPLEQALESDRLGNPSRTMQQVLESCGARAALDTR